MKKIFNFIIKSSADPKATSMTVRFALLGAIPYLMQALGLVCQFGYTCIDVDPTLLEAIVDGIANLIYSLLAMISIAGATYGLARKLYRTIKGENLALKE